MRNDSMEVKEGDVFYHPKFKYYIRIIKKDYDPCFHEPYKGTHQTSVRRKTYDDAVRTHMTSIGFDSDLKELKKVTCQQG